MTLEDYLRDNIEKGIFDFVIKAINEDGDIIFNIAPINQDGDTMDFLVTYNDLEEWK